MTREEKPNKAEQSDIWEQARLHLLERKKDPEFKKSCDGFNPKFCVNIKT